MFNNQYGYYPNYNFDTQTNQYYFVDGIEAAKAFQVNRPNTTVLLMDSQQPMCYKKQTDMYGKTIVLEAFDLVPHQEKPPVQYVTKQEFDDFIASFKKEG